jgi:hypothetical protein
MRNQQRFRLTGKERGRNGYIVTGLVEVRQIQSIIPHLIDGRFRVRLATHLELQHKKYLPNRQLHINPFPILGIECSK